MKVVKRYKLLVLSTYWDVIYSMVTVISNTLCILVSSQETLKFLITGKKKHFVIVRSWVLTKLTVIIS